MRNPSCICSCAPRGSSAQAYRHIVDAFVEDWSRYIPVKVTNRLVKSAGDLAAHRALPGYDALHLASALSFRERISSGIMFWRLTENCLWQP
jgi:hypothetical protein